MPDGQADFQSRYPQDIEIEIDAATIADRLVLDQRFIDLVAKEVAKALTRQARGIGNIFGTWAQKPAPVQTSRQRTR